MLLLAGACKPAGTPQSNAAPLMPSSSDYRQLAESRLGSKIQYTFNEDHTLVLCVASVPVAAPAITHSLQFLVIALEGNRLIYEDKIANAQVEWYNNTQLKILTSPGTVQIKPDLPKNYYFFDLETKQKIMPGANKI